MIWQRAFYRVRQFFWHLFPRVDAATREEALDSLPVPCRALFLRQQPADQAHALKIWRQLKEAGHREETLLLASLLHDVGKSKARLVPWQRAVMVLGPLLWPRRFAGLATKSGPGWRYAFWVQAHHPAIGAEMAAEAGCPTDVVAMIRRHHDAHLPEGHLAELLRCLQAVDDAN